MDKLGELCHNFFVAVFGLGSLAGVAVLVHQFKRWPPLSLLIGAALYSGTCALIVCLMLYDLLRDHPYALTGVSMLSGIGGADVILIAVRLLFKGVRVDLRIRDNAEDELPFGDKGPGHE